MERGIGDAERERVLAAGTANGQKLEVVQMNDGSVAIAVDGRPGDDYRWPGDKLEHCMTVYLGLLRHRVEE